MNKKAFTLAEVLITLGIIGIVAALTMPILVNKYRKIVIANQFKKTYSVIQNTIVRAEKNHGTLGDWPCFSGSHGGKLFLDVDAFMKNISEVLNVTKKESGGLVANNPVSMCGSSSDYITMDGKVLKSKSGDPYWKKETTLYIADGSCIYFRSLEGNEPIYADLSKNHGNNSIMEVYMDVNGSKNQPNKLGIDLFAFEIYYNGKIVPYKNYDPKNCSTLVSASQLGGGYSCAARIISDNYTIKDDYPWSWSRKLK